MTWEHGHTEPANDSEIMAHIYRGIKIVKETLKFHDICDFAHSSVFDDRYIVQVRRYVRGGFERHTYSVGHFEDDSILYGGTRYYSRDFPRLEMVIRNRDTESLLEELE